MKYLKPVSVKRSHWQHVEAQINAIFDEVIYDPIRALLRRRDLELKNEASDLIEAINTEKIFYSEGAFYGTFSGKVSRALREIGAIYDGRKKAWVIAQFTLPADIQRALLQAQLRFQLFARDILSVIDTIEPKRIRPINYKPTVDQVQEEIYRTLQSVAAPTIMSEKTKKRIADEWALNLDLWIKDWVGDNIIKLREDVQANTLAGGRAAGLVSTLQHNYGTSKTKAKFLARQETSLMVSKLREAEYAEAGITHYMWETAHDERVRPDFRGMSEKARANYRGSNHFALDARIFRFDEKPITNHYTGVRNSPGEDYGCRCLARPRWTGAVAPDDIVVPSRSPEFVPEK